MPVSDLPLPPAWRHCAGARDVPALWSRLDPAARQEGLLSLFRLPDGQDGHAREARWSAWLEAGLPVDALFTCPVPALAGVASRRSTVLGHSLAEGYAGLALLALEHGADANPVASEERVRVLRPGDARPPLHDVPAANGLVGRPLGVWRPVLEALVRGGWDPSCSLAAPNSFLGECVVQGWTGGFDLVASLKPGIDWNATTDGGRHLLSLLAFNRDSFSTWWPRLSALGASPRFLPRLGVIPFLVTASGHEDGQVLDGILSMDPLPRDVLRQALLSGGAAGTPACASIMAALDARELASIPLAPSSPSPRSRL